MKVFFYFGGSPKTKSGVSWKIWKIERKGLSVTTWWGPATIKNRRPVNRGWLQKYSRAFESEGAAIAHEQELIREKLGKGYERANRGRNREKKTLGPEGVMPRQLATLWSRLYKVVLHMADRLVEENGVFRDSLLSNIQDLCDVLPKLNTTGDAQLEEMRKEVETKLLAFRPQELREDADARMDVADEALTILEKMQGYMGMTTDGGKARGGVGGNEKRSGKRPVRSKKEGSQLSGEREPQLM